MKKLHKVILLGSGGLSIGQAGEFDYSGTQALKALVEEGIEVVVVNPNIATVQTNPIKNVKIYLYPIESHWVEKVIKLEKPDGIIAGFGGQTALNCIMEMDERGILKSHGIQNLGTPIESLRITEDRKLFSETMTQIGMQIAPSASASSVIEALEASKKIGFPLIVRAAYSLGGLGSGFAHNETELHELVENALSLSPQVLIEKSVRGWKEIEFEVMRDSNGHAVTICNMENIDPMGIHTGDSIVVAPCQTLTDKELQNLRTASLKIANALKITGECNVQFALDPQSYDFYVIEVNARLSRSSALASKASGYPIAFIAAKLVIDRSLLELKNPVTGITSAFYEPALDYITIKIPRWDMNKFRGVSRRLGSSMKSVGEIMGIGRNFAEALQKATRMVLENPTGLSKRIFSSKKNVEVLLSHPTDERIFAIAEAFRQGFDIQKVAELTSIHPWFLAQIRDLVLIEDDIKRSVKNSSIAQTPAENWRRWKIHGFGDEQIAFLSGAKNIREAEMKSLEIREQRKKHRVTPYIKKIDTTSAEYPSPSNYLYMTYAASAHDPLESLNGNGKKTAIVLGSGAYRVGSSVEFDWCAVSCSEELRRLGWRSVMINCNPETVSTDFNSSTRLYFEELTLERTLDIYEFEKADGVVLSMGGQRPNCLAMPLSESGVKILGHDFTAIDRSEDRHQFSQLLDQEKIKQPAWTSAKSRDEIESFINQVGFPVLIRPSYVLSGAAMNVAWNHESLDLYLTAAQEASSEHPIVVSKFVEGAKEIEVDGVAADGQILLGAISEHVENAGIHSGDATLIFPAVDLNIETEERIKHASRVIGKALKLNGPFNIQFLVKDNQVQVIECNTRASRSMPFVSKVSGNNLSKVATRVMLKIDPTEHDQWLGKKHFSNVGVKAALFSFNRTQGVDPVTGVEMLSTGEVGCISGTFSEALMLALESSNIRLPKKGILVSAGPKTDKEKFLSFFSTIQKMGVPVYATEGTAVFLSENGHPVSKLSWPEAAEIIRKKRVDFVINIPKNLEKEELLNSGEIRKSAVLYGCSLLTDMEKVTAYLSAVRQNPDFIGTHLPQKLNSYHSE